MKRARRVLLFVAVNALVVISALVATEGVASLTLIASDLYRSRPNNRDYARYDELLGWVNQPNLFLPNMYGRGVWFHTNAQGFRSITPTAPARPPGWVRIVCSGDSYTMGHGIDNEHTWCHQLESPAARIETVNLGQNGFGIDQAYLRYRRDAATLEHDVHVFAFIGHDFVRMKHTRMFGRAKPMLRVVDGQLTTANVPVPTPPLLDQWLPHWRRSAGELRIVRLLVRGLHRSPASPEQSDAEVAAVFAAVLDDLRAISRRNGSKLVLVFLPVQRDYENDSSLHWRRLARRETSRLGVPFIDLTPALRELSSGEAKPFFLGRNVHYADAGHAWVAAELRTRLLAMPDVAAVLTRNGEPPWPAAPAPPRAAPRAIRARHH